MKRFWPVAVVFFIILAGILLLLLLQRTSQELPGNSTGQVPTPPAVTGNSPPTARLADLDGQVMVTHADGTEVSAEVDMTLVTGDRVVTGADGQATIVFFDSTRSTLDSRTAVQIDESVIDTTNYKKQQVHLTLVSGRVWSRILKLLDPESRYEIDYSGTVSGVRGTAFLLSGVNNAYRLDVFDGTVITVVKKSASVPVGFSLALPNINSAPPDTQILVQPTPDDVRNDHWVRKQLELDDAFAEQAAAARKKLGLTDDPQEISAIGHEAGPYTLNQPGVEHSNFQFILVNAAELLPSTFVGGELQLHAVAVFNTPNGLQKQDVTDVATWQVSDPARMSVDSGGVLRVRGAVSPESIIVENVQVVARWNDGTHEHSGTATIRIIPPPNSTDGADTDLFQ